MVKNYRPASVGMMPAHPETYILHLYFMENQVEVVKANVIGWQVSSERELTPLVVDPKIMTGDDWFVLHADGRVECSDGRCWENCDDWITEERRRYRDAA